MADFKSATAGMRLRTKPTTAFRKCAATKIVNNSIPISARNAAFLRLMPELSMLGNVQSKCRKWLGTLRDRGGGGEA